MRFVSSLSLLSLVGLGLATPVNARDDAPIPRAPQVGAALSFLGAAPSTGLLGLRDEKKQGVRRGRADDNGGISSGSGSGVLLRAHEPVRPIEEPAALGTREEPTEAKGKGKPKSKPDGKGKGEEPKANGKGKPKGKGKSEGKGKGKCNDARHTPCLHTDEVDVLVDAYVRMLSKWNDTDAKFLADSFRDTSDSINILAGVPLGSPTFPTKQAFIDHQHTQPDNLPLVVTHKSPYSCDEIALIWKATFGAAQKSVRGVTILGATKDKGYWQIKTIDVEFNNIAYLLDMGGTYTMPTQ